ncbi:MAG TPA: glycosyltransferase [Aliidongia sp.]|nr:glycosyltransferase [Aliidongia sp.]
MAVPTVSVLVTTYNHAPFVRECLASLAEQTTRDFEIIITDDASRDGTADVIQQWLDETGTAAILVRNEANRGICANRNAALSLAKGLFVCSLSGDDAYEPDRIARQVAEFERQPPHVAVVYSDIRMIDARSRDLGITFLDHVLGNEPVPEADVFSRLLRGSFMPSPAAMIRRTALDQVGPYDESLFYEDYDMWLRLSARFRFRHLLGCLVRYRVLPTSMSHSMALRPAMMASTVRILQSWLGKVGPLESDLQWRIGLRQVLQSEDRQARRSLALAGRRGKFGRGLLARIFSVPGACTAVRQGYKIVLLARAMRLRWYFLRAAFVHRS